VEYSKINEKKLNFESDISNFLRKENISFKLGGAERESYFFEFCPFCPKPHNF